MTVVETLPRARLHVVAFRHGETTLNAQRRLTGQLDPPLTPRGREQAAALAPVAGGAFDRRIYSGLRRAAQTLEIACAAAGCAEAAAAAEVDPRWRERSFGTLAGASNAAWTQPPDLDAAPPGGESYRALAERVAAALDDLAAEARAAGRPRRVLISTHSGVLRCLTALAGDDVDPLEPFTLPGAANGAVVAFDYAAPSTPRPASAPAPAPRPSA